MLWIIDLITSVFAKKIVGNYKRKYGYIRDRKDSRDKLYKDVLANEVQVIANLPSSVDLRGKLPACYDQGQLGSCTANGIAGAIEFIEPNVMPSRLFIYYNERVLEGTVNEDAGAQIRDGIQTVITQGVCQETEWPYEAWKYRCKPSSRCYKDALKDTINSYLRVNGLQELQSCLAAGFPVVIGIQVYESFESSSVAQSGMVPMPAPAEDCLGGHCVLVVGYDMATQMFLVRNSWGTSWGLNGYFWIPFAYLADPNLCSDNWTIRGANILQSKKPV